MFSVIQKQTGYSFLYNDALLSKTKPVTLNLHNVSLTETLGLCFSGQSISYVIVNKTIVLREKEEERIEDKKDIQMPPGHCRR
ncbi:STN domain-containing protein [Paraflavitalea speifideaquila]|uniref:STN domain-containing protein n=1 Tax=Paraflavitalea speifideaquila TaxID=3076558 RepID=UPI0028ECB9E9|nr:STN domain-containing protein [Paraflavitalea speifideiaquila]